MSRGRTRRCVVCGAEGGRLESNHVAARANDREIVVAMCASCHAVFTDWQWRLGILRRESVEDRARHTEQERFWALCEGFVLLALMGGPKQHGAAWVALGRAAGTAQKIIEEQARGARSWGPRPARVRPGRPRLPTLRGNGDPREVLEAVLRSADTWLAADPSWPTVRRGMVSLANVPIEVPGDWGPVVEQLSATLDALAAAQGVSDLASGAPARRATLLAIRELLASVATSGRSTPPRSDR